MSVVTTRTRMLRSLAVTVMALVLLAFFYGPLLRHPGAFLFRGGGDGLKNYYAFAYHVKHDSTWMQFEGMHHPFGEQIGFPDAQPALSNAAKALSAVFPAVADHTPAIINLAALLGLVLTVLSVYWILRRLGVPWILAGIGGLALTALSPQVLRMEAGHHALAYGWTITLPILFLLRIRQGASPWTSAVLGGSITLLGLYLHPYTGMIATCLIGVALLIDAPWRRWRTQRSAFLATALFIGWPVVVFLGIQKATDHHVGRTERPLGYFEYQTSLDALLTPPSGQRSPLSKAVIPWEKHQEFEASAYLGLGALLALIVVLPFVLRWYTRADQRTASENGWPHVLTVLLLASVALAAFAMGFPFSKEHGPTPWDVPFLGQFRSPGRFAWALYYALGLFGLYGTWWLVQRARGRQRVAAWALAITVPVLYLYESAYYHVPVSAAIMRDRNVLDKEQLTEPERALVEAVKRVPHRVLIALPHFLNGSDELLLSADGPALGQAMLVSYHTGLPMAGYSLARTSVPETIEQIGLFTRPWYPRPIEQRYAPTDRLLLMAVGEPANEAEAAVLALAAPMGTFGEARLFSITAEELFRDRTAALFDRVEELRRTLAPTPDGWYSTAADPRAAYFSLDERPALRAYRGSGGYEGLHSGKNILARIPPGRLKEGEPYVASYWIYHRGTLRCHALTCVALRDSTGHEEWPSCSDPRFARMVNGDWSLVEIPFTAGPGHVEHRIFTEAAPWYRDELWVDEVMVRPARAETFKVLREEYGQVVSVLYNGHHLTRPR